MKIDRLEVISKNYFDTGIGGEKLLIDVKISMTKKLFREMWAGMTQAEKRNCLQVTKVRELFEVV